MKADETYVGVHTDEGVFLPSVNPKYLSRKQEPSDSLGRIADELDEQAGSLTKDGYMWQEDAIHDFAKRIRKLAEENEHGR